MSSSADIIAIASTGDASRVMREMKCRALFSPYYLTKVVLGYVDLIPELHMHDSDLFISRMEMGIRRQWIEWPRGFFKTTTYTIGTGVWFVLPVSEEDHDFAINEMHIPEDTWFRRMALHDQDATQLIAMETDTNAKKKVTEIKWHFEENQLFRQLFPEIAYTGSENPWSNNCIKIRRVGYGKRLPEGTFEAIGVGGALQSRHYKIVWEDDLVGKDATESEAVMEKTIRWHGLLNGAFENAAEQIRFGVSNRWGMNDLNRSVRENEPEFVFYTRKAIELGSDGQDHPIFPYDARGRVRFTVPKLEEIKKSYGRAHEYDFYCQYFNEPRMPGTKEVDLGRAHTYTVLDGRIHCSCSKTFAPSQLLRYGHYDPYNAKGVRSRSRPALACVATSADKHVFLLDYYIERGDYTKVYDKIAEYNDIYKWNTCFTYEDVGSQNMVGYYLNRWQGTTEFKEKGHRKLPRIVAVSPRGKPKEIRVRDYLLPIINSDKGHFFSYRTGMQHFISQCDTFPHEVPDHDYDLLDCLAQGATVWHYPFGQDDAETYKREEEEYLKNLGKPYTQMEVHV
jgi:hypothetical protein